MDNIWLLVFIFLLDFICIFGVLGFVLFFNFDCILFFIIDCFFGIVLDKEFFLIIIGFLLGMGMDDRLVIIGIGFFGFFFFRRDDDFLIFL